MGTIPKGASGVNRAKKVRAEELAHFVPRTDEGRASFDERPHDEIDDEPRCKNEHEPDGHVQKYGMRGADIAASARRHVLPSRIREKYCGDKDGNVDARIENVLRCIGDITERAFGLALISAHNDAVGYPRSEHKRGGNDKDDSDNESEPC